MIMPEKIKYLREKKRLTQAELSKKTGVKKAAIYKYEAELVVNIKRSVVSVLADDFDTIPAYLLDLEVDMPKVPKHTHYMITITEYKTLLEANQNTPMYLPILLGGYMGLRKGEALGFSWQKAHFTTKKITIDKNRQIANKEEVLKEPKSDRSKRTLFHKS